MQPLPPVRILGERDLARIGGRRARHRVLRRIVREQAQVVAPGGDGTVHDCATTLILGIVRRRPWPRGNRRAAFTGAAVLYRANFYVVVDGEGLLDAVVGADHGELSPGALCEELTRVAQPVGATH